MGSDRPKQRRILAPAPPTLRLFILDALQFWLGMGKAWVNTHSEIEILWHGRHYVIRIIRINDAYPPAE